ncbi:MAG: hypothetical protein IPK62_15650 [Bacteroidetes bacterium]|nr:hypothetical protein [Bacteroidota bacterium]
MKRGDTLAKAFKKAITETLAMVFAMLFNTNPISYYRRTNPKEYVEIDRRALSALLSGTPKQITTLIQMLKMVCSAVFMFYVMNMKLIWKDVLPLKQRTVLDVHFERLGNEFYSLYQTLQANPDVHFFFDPITAIAVQSIL